VARVVAGLGGAATIDQIAKQGIDQKTIGEAIRRLAARDWACKDGPALRIAGAWATAATAFTADERLVAHLKQAGKETAGELAAKFGGAALELLQSLHPRLLVVKDWPSSRKGSRFANGSTS
jgi:hypothetical protein